MAEGGTYASGSECASKENPGSFSPGWDYDGSTLYRLGAGEELPFTSHGENVVLRTSGIEISCKTLQSEGTVIGGSPGKDTLTVVFAECSVVGYPNCKVMSKASSLPPWGTIELAAKMELVYTGTKAQAKKKKRRWAPYSRPRAAANLCCWPSKANVRCHQAAK